MAIVKKIMGIHDSGIKVLNRPDEGTSFNFDPPVYTMGQHPFSFGVNKKPFQIIDLKGSSIYMNPLLFEQHRYEFG